MAHLVHDGGEKVVMPGGRAGRVGVSRVAAKTLPNSASSSGVPSRYQPRPAASASSVICVGVNEPRYSPAMSVTPKSIASSASSCASVSPASLQRAIAASTKKSSSAWVSTPSSTMTRWGGRRGRAA